MKKYLLFCYDFYYPTGGMNDLMGSHDSIAECLNDERIKKYSEYQIIDRDTFKVVKANDRLNDIYVD